MNKIFIICGHGQYGTALQSTIELLLGKNKDLHYIDFLEDDNDVSLREKMFQTIEQNSNSQILFICDIMGGTPFKLAAEIANDNEDIEVVAGCNVMSIIEGSFKKDVLTLEDLAKFIVESSKKSTIKFEKVVEKVAEQDKVGDGI
ncbi:PTS sugar transporter subunit IIA [Paratissierella segnis]|jgi:PTS system N-acetylgalactosamine-specific IIA component|uniref:PTS sugar transporter subunit IIA n=1 Tax=Paratissierella segnis TaxID=2763679 RepID=A0A926EWB6_9FIRM|nr:PTS sugar transporter subunit IIA [Paratissierella segnis]MBC8587425.1 PTS sugar transporter subunit IIA [Paratissierella segnis]